MMMHWSIYDVLVLITGLITLIIVIAPVREIPVATRAKAGAIGGALILISLVLASIPFLRYPWIVVVAPVIASLCVVAVIGKALRGATALQHGEQGRRADPFHPERPEGFEAEQTTFSGLDPDLSAQDLMQLAVRDQSAWTAIARHPAAYDGLLDWLALHGDDRVRAAVGARRNG